ncbi:MAG: acyl-CoA dehydrogenase family protein [Flavobacteriales bacterium]|nr:acyl-CoA dehydrogenase family protein [Flavobacteriales bacterium]
MEIKEEKKQAIKGGEFIVKETHHNDIFIPEEWSEEQMMIAGMCKDFIKAELTPRLDEIDSMKDPKLMPLLLEKAGELGLLGLSVPEDLGGMGVDFKSSMLATEALGAGHSFSVAYGAHTGIGTLPLLYYGNDSQKAKYISKLATGEWKAAYCLTEPSAGSDANSGKTKAKLTDDGKHYVINGQKMWITNGGFANLFTVFAKIDDDKNLTAFLVEGDSEGITLNAEEKKMGIKGSSTRQVFFNDVKVPVENLLYEREKGFKIAVNILNIGRIKLAGGVMGGAKAVITETVKYANEREQFNVPISSFGAIKHKLAEQCIKTYACESATYRATQNIEDAIQDLIANGMNKGEATLKGIEEFAPECAILKVIGSEVLDYVSDEGVQVHGGMGYSAEKNIERSYRDSRINRIFEGTNEINRMLTVSMILRKAGKGEINLLGPAKEVGKELLSIPDFGNSNGSLLSEEIKTVKNFKKALLMIAGAAVQKFENKLQFEQEIVMNIADLINIIYVCESTLLRVQKAVEKVGTENYQEQIDMLKVCIYDSCDEINKSGKDAINSFTEGDQAKMMLMGLKRFTKHNGVNVKELRRRIAQKLINKNEYCY